MGELLSMLGRVFVLRPPIASKRRSVTHKQELVYFVKQHILVEKPFSLAIFSLLSLFLFIYASITSLFTTLRTTFLQGMMLSNVG